MPPSFERPSLERMRFNMLVWGDSGCGKTTLASTAPGEKLWVQFDPQGVASIANRSDVHVLDLAGETPTSTMIEFNKPDPYSIGRFLKDNPQVETVVVDSMTALVHMAQVYAVTKAGGKSSYDVPGINGYGVRNNILRRVAASLHQVCAMYDRSIIMTTHEGAADKEQDSGAIISVTMALSDSVANSVSLRFNEVWYMKDTGREHIIYVRPHGVYRPMKSRMFEQTGPTNFNWLYDAATRKGDGIAEWWTQWQSNGGNKIALPKGGKK